MAEIIERLARALQMKWNLLVAYSPQSSGKAESKNQTSSKSVSEPDDWASVMPVVTLQKRRFPEPESKSHPLRFFHSSLSPHKSLQRQKGDGNLKTHIQLQLLATATAQ